MLSNLISNLVTVKYLLHGSGMHHLDMIFPLNLCLNFVSCAASKKLRWSWLYRKLDLYEPSVPFRWNKALAIRAFFGVNYEVRLQNTALHCVGRSGKAFI